MSLKKKKRVKLVKIPAITAGFILLVVIIIRSDWFWNMLNPIFHKNIIYKYSGIYKLDPLLIAAIIQVESQFNPIATSRAGALGLMQIKPKTAVEVAKELKLDYINTEELYEPEMNINIGFYYISKMYNEFNGNLALSLAAYNAGIKNAKRWARECKGMNEDELTEKVNFPETRLFIKKVTKTYKYFKSLQKIKRILRKEE